MHQWLHTPACFRASLSAARTALEHSACRWVELSALPGAEQMWIGAQALHPCILSSCHAFLMQACRWGTTLWVLGRLWTRVQSVWMQHWPQVSSKPWQQRWRLLQLHCLPAVETQVVWLQHWPLVSS